jgi:hypothetical protein
MNTRFSKSILVLAAVGLLGAGSVLAGNGPGECDGTGDGTCTSATGGGNGQGKGNRNGGSGGERGGSPLQKTDRLDQVLDLNDDQETLLLTFLQNQEVNRKTLRTEIWERYGPLICQQREANRGALHEFLLGIADADQKLILQEMEARREADGANRQNRRGRGEQDCSQFDEG